MSNIDRFHKAYFQAPSGCWLWLFAIGHDGYGIFKVGVKNIRAHRFSYETFIGPIAKGMLVLHKCDVRNCVNPDHLWSGTSAQNSLDMRLKGRSKCGETNGRAKLSASQALEIFGSAESHGVLAAKYQISKKL